MISNSRCRGLRTWLLSCSLLCAAGVAGAEPAASPGVDDAHAFVQAAEQELAEAGQYAERAEWVYENFITSDTEALSARAREAFTAAQVRLASEAVHYQDIPQLDAVTARKLRMLRAGIVVPAPADPQKLAEQSSIVTSLAGMYGKGQYCRKDGSCLDLGQLSDIMAKSRDPDELLEAWDGWRQVAPPMKPLFARQVELANEGAKELGFPDLGAMWRSNYDMAPDDFAAELDRLWGQVKPLYQALHCHVRAKLAERYGTDEVPSGGPIPAHLLGNMWAQSWANIYDLVAPADSGSGYDLDDILREQGFDAARMVHTGEAFFSSLGFEELPATFWKRSLFIQPRDRNVICHPSAWDIDEQDDLRIKMCIKIDAEDFNTIHHELGHNYYQRAYKDQTFLHRDGANDGFHEAVGDTIALSITPAYLKQIGLLDQVPDASGDVPLLLRRALEKVAFLPFGLLVDKWRWEVFSGQVGPDDYNQAWWDLRREYQGVSAPDERPADAFDPGAKYHVPANTPYARYFLATILQFQFHRALCRIAGFEGPIHRCSIYGNQAAGERLAAMLAMGRSRPWPDALEALTGQRQMDATAILDYFAPLKAWLDQQNEDRTCGW